MKNYALNYFMLSSNRYACFPLAIQNYLQISDIPSVVKEIVDKWISTRPNQEEKLASEVEDVDTRLARLLESQTLATTVQRQYTADELRIREAVLAQYSQLSDEVCC